jgi:hypothetical protein
MRVRTSSRSSVPLFARWQGEPPTGCGSAENGSMLLRPMVATRFANAMRGAAIADVFAFLAVRAVPEPSEPLLVLASGLSGVGLAAIHRREVWTRFMGVR